MSSKGVAEQLFKIASSFHQHHFLACSPSGRVRHRVRGEAPALGILADKLSCLRWISSCVPVTFLHAPFCGSAEHWAHSGSEEVPLKIKAVLQGSIWTERLPSW
jgi:hypothetical protein